MSSIADLFAVGSELTFEGVKYSLRRPVLLEQAKFSQWLKDDAKAECGRGELPDEVRDNLTRAVMRDIGAKYYEPDSPGYVNSLQTPHGFAKMLHIIFESEHPGIPEEQVQRVLEAGLKEQFAKLVMLDSDDPKAMAELLISQGFRPEWLNINAS